MTTIRRARRLVVAPALLAIPLLFLIDETAAAPAVVGAHRAEPHVQSCSPYANELNVPTDAMVSVTFDTNMDTSTLNVGTILVEAGCCGFMDFDDMTFPDASTVEITIQDGFLAGDVVTVVLTTDIKSDDGTAMPQSHAWSFTIATEPGGDLFPPHATYDVSPGPNNIVAACLDADWHPDLAVTPVDYITVLRNDGAGSFDEQYEYYDGGEGMAIDIGDLDHDGDLDVLTLRQATTGWNGKLHVYRNDSPGLTLMATHDVPNGPRDVCAVDLEGDGDIDAAHVGSYGWLFLLGNDGSGNFTTKDSVATVIHPLAVKSGDLDGDGATDLVTAGHDGGSYVSTFSNDGQGSFTLVDTYPTGSSTCDVSVADLDGDGNLDFATADAGDNATTIYLNDGSGSFDWSQQQSAGDHPQAVVAADVDGDGALDLALPNKYGGTLGVLKNNGAGWFAPAFPFPVAAAEPVDISAADLDRDGTIDLAVTSALISRVTVLLNGAPVDTPEASIVTALLNRTGLLPNIPNPFSVRTEVRFDLARKGSVALEIHDVAGRLVRTLVRGTLRPGTRRAVWAGLDDRGRPVPAGVYFCRLETEEGTTARKVLLVR